MVFAGVATCTTLTAAVGPREALVNMFGSNLTDPLANLILRSWSFLVFLTGALLIYGAFNEDSRMLCTVTAGISKIGFLPLIITFGSAYIDNVWVTVMFDLIVVMVLACYVVSARKIADQSTYSG